ncbi:MAG: class I SAM-dependent methyltransferase [Treponema sp.]|nr:class I SAM-dependent methyltransferase [Treponema sp.]
MPNNAVTQNKAAWEHRAYEFRVSHYGIPQSVANEMMSNPKKFLRYHAEYFNDVDGKNIASICGSDGRRAVALSLLGAKATVFDISDPQKKYALELAEAAGVNIDYIIGDFCETDTIRYVEYFDYAYAEGGILHYFHDLDKFFAVLFNVMKSNSTLILSDFHPFGKVATANWNPDSKGGATETDVDYFDICVKSGDVAFKQFFNEKEHDSFPDISVRRYTLSDILNAIIRAGFNVVEFNEHPGWVNKKRPGEFTVVAKKV